MTEPKGTLIKGATINVAKEVIFALITQGKDVEIAHCYLKNYITRSNNK